MKHEGEDVEPIAPEELALRCQRGLPEDPRPFELLVAQYKTRVFGTAYRLMGNRQDAEDQSQEVFLKVYRGIKGLGQPATLTTWIDRITVNTCLDALSHQRRRPSTVPLAPAGGDGEEEPRFADTTNQTPEAALEQRELRRCLEAALIQLDTPARAALALRDIDDRPYGEIVELLGVGLSAVKMRIHRARLAFQEVFDRVCPGAWQSSQAA